MFENDVFDSSFVGKVYLHDTKIVGLYEIHASRYETIYNTKYHEQKVYMLSLLSVESVRF